MAVNDSIPKSRLTLTYRTDVRGKKKDVQLPFRLLVLGDLSGGTSKDAQLDLDQRAVRSLDGKNLNAVMKDMGSSMSFAVTNHIDPDVSEELSVELPINSMKSFSAAQVAQGVPKIKALLLLKKLLLEVQGNLDNRKEFRKLLRQMAGDVDAVKALASQLSGFENFKVPALPQPKSDDAN